MNPKALTSIQITLSETFHHYAEQYNKWLGESREYVDETDPDYDEQREDSAPRRPSRSLATREAAGIGIQHNAQRNASVPPMRAASRTSHQLRPADRAGDSARTLSPSESGRGPSGDDVLIDFTPPEPELTHEAVVSFLRKLPPDERNRLVVNSYTPEEFGVFIYHNVTADMFQCFHNPVAPIFPCPLQQGLDEARDYMRKVCAEREDMETYVKHYDRTLQTERQRHKAELQRAENRVNDLLKKNQDLKTLYLRSISDVGGGLDPIADRTFSERFTDHHAAVYQWCRRNLRKQKRRDGKDIDPDVWEVVKDQTVGQQRAELSLPRLAEMVIWNQIEINAICPWSPTNPFDKSEDIIDFEKWGQKCERPDKPGHELKIDFWRSYTACLAVQSRDFPYNVAHCAKGITEAALVDVVALVLPAGEGGGPQLDLNGGALQEIMQDIVRTAADMKCQRGLFDIENVRKRSKFHSKTMIDCSEKDWETEGVKNLVVKAVLSDGIIRRPHRGSSEMLGRACMAQVIAGPE